MEQHCKQMSLVGVGSTRSVWATLRLPSLMACAFLVYTAQDPGCLVGELSGAGPRWRALPRSKPLWFRVLATSQRHRRGWACVLCPSQVRADQVTSCLASALSPGGLCILSPPLSQPLGFPGCAARAPSQVCPVSPLGSWSLTAALLADVNCTAYQEDLVSNWEPANSLVETAISGAEIAPRLPALAVARLPLCLRQGEGLVHSWLALLWYLLSPLPSEQARLCLIAFHMKVLSLSLSLSFSLSGYPTVWVPISH